MNITTELKASVLIVEPIQERLTQLTQLIAAAGLDVMTVPSGEQALEVIENSVPEMILLNSQLPGMDGFETCSRLKQHQVTQTVPILFIKAMTESIDHRQLLAVGSVGLITQPFQGEQVLIQIHAHIALHRQQQMLLQQHEQLKQPIKYQQPTKQAFSTAEAKSNYQAPAQLCAEPPTLIGHSQQIEEVLTQMDRFSNSPLNVLINGECGTGKELVARAIHKGSAYAAGPFVAVNCSAIPAELAESEFFGSMRGAFTGAVKDRKGHFELADGGTLFLDEIGEMPKLLQAKLLRALEQREITPVGGTHPKPINIRVIAATNANLLKMIQAGTFRSDLYFRLASCTIKIPPLRTRQPDIALLAEHFLNQLAAGQGQMKKAFSQAALKALKQYSFPGNVRELKNIIEQAFFSCDGNTILPEHLNFIETMLVPETQQTPPQTPLISKPQPLPVTPTDVLKSIQAEHPLMRAEGKILVLIQQLGYINNALCQQLLEGTRHQATYLLKKMTSEGVLVREGNNRATSYRLP